MRRISLSFAALALWTGATAAQPVGGHYTVDGVNFDGSTYSGEADIVVAGTCSITWKIGDTQQEGTCSLQNGSFSASYVLEGQKGTVSYAVGPGGRLQGKWTLEGREGSGTETLTPAGAAADSGRAQSATDFVRGLYQSDPIYNPGFDKPFEARLTGAALVAAEKNDKESAASGEIACIDFVLSLNAQDSDEPTVRRTLKLSEPGPEKEGAATVDASFINFEFEGVPADQQTRTVVRYDLRRVDGTWRISDMSAKADGEEGFGWRLSELCR